MSKSHLRKDKTCLNCRHVVEQRFCPNCGQENIDTRKTFHHLFIHFLEDLTHYENAFWKTIKNLYLKPASLTREYLSGKRLSYLAPVRLYIFISFVTFFLFTLVPNDDKSDLVEFNQAKKKEHNSHTKKAIKDSLCKEAVKIDELYKKGVLTQTEADSLKILINEGKASKKVKAKEKNSFLNLWYDSVAEMDSIRKIKPDEIGDFEYWINKKAIAVNDKYTNEEVKEKFKESAIHNFPKTLFIYMPLFAFVLWLFHGKKRWFYFDHGIFTLHYFSFLLLSMLIVFFFRKIMSFVPDNTITDTITSVGATAGYIWMLYYFFPAHHRFYGETRTVSFFKSIAMFFINSILMLIVLLAFVVYTFINLH